MSNCSLEDDGVPSYEDTCSFTCNTGYELTGSDTRTCQSNGSWSGNDVVCSNETVKASVGNSEDTKSVPIITGTILGSLLIILIIIILIVVTILIRRRDKQQLLNSTIDGKGMYIAMIHS